jgi:hypothetical protein
MPPSDPRELSPNLTPGRLVWRGLAHDWRLHLPVMLATAVAVAVLTGSLLVGASMRGSLRDLTEERLGRVDCVMVSDLYFRGELAAAIPGAAPAILLNGSALDPSGARRANRVNVLGVDGRFWALSRSTVSEAAAAEESLTLWMNRALRGRLDAVEGAEFLVRVPQPSAIPLETYLGRRDQSVATLRLESRGAPPVADLDDFSLQPTQLPPQNAFVPLDTLARRLERTGRINAILAPGNAEALQAIVRREALIEDTGLRWRMTDAAAILESDRIFLGEPALDLARRAAADAGAPAPVATLAYLMNRMRVGGREIPYSIAAGVEGDGPPDDMLLLNAWAADDLAARPGDTIELTWFAEGGDGTLAETSATLRVAGILPMDDPRIDDSLTPEFPGMVGVESMDQWDPPFTFDMSRIRPVDEDYWDEHRAAPKAIVSLATARRLWGNRFGATTGLRWDGEWSGAVSEALANRFDPTEFGLAFRPARSQLLEASRGATDFGGLFIGFSLFLLISAAMLIAILFRMGVERRARQFGLMQAIGLTRARIARWMLAEAALVAGAGGLLGSLLAIGYGGVMVHGLRTWWIGAIGAPVIRLVADPPSLLIGLMAGWIVAMAVAALTLRSLLKLMPGGLLAGNVAPPEPAPAAGRRPLAIGLGLLLIGAILPISGLGLSAQRQAALFFAGGAALLGACLGLFGAWLRKGGRGDQPLTQARLGLLTARRRPGRSLLVAGLMASATFLIVAVGANRKTATAVTARDSGSGGMTLLAESALPILRPLSESLPAGTIHFALRVRPGDDTSCLNLYQAARPTILGAPAAMIELGGFRFADSLAASEAEKANPWRMLDGPSVDGAIPAIGDYNSVVWLLHKGLGDLIEVDGRTLRIVGLLAGSIFQNGLLIGEEAFERSFPEAAGWRSFLIDAPPDQLEAIGRRLEGDFDDEGLETTPADERLNALMGVENTYLAAFQMLGGLGLLLGTLGLAMALARGLIERRREFALLEALGWSSGRRMSLAVAENVVLLLVGMISGTACAALAVAPSLVSRASVPPWASLGWTLAGILVFGGGVTTVAAWMTLRGPAVAALKDES